MAAPCSANCRRKHKTTLRATLSLLLRVVCSPRVWPRGAQKISATPVLYGIILGWPCFGLKNCNFFPEISYTVSNVEWLLSVDFDWVFGSFSTPVFTCWCRLLTATVLELHRMVHYQLYSPSCFNHSFLWRTAVVTRKTRLNVLSPCNPPTAHYCICYDSQNTTSSTSLTALTVLIENKRFFCEVRTALFQTISCLEDLPWLRRSAEGLAPRRPGFDIYV